MTGPAKVKGDRAEREAALLLGDLLGAEVRRLLGAGRRDDRGDLDLPGWAIQVADWQDLAMAVRTKPLDAEVQAARADDGSLGVAMLRLWGGAFRVVMTPETFALIAHELSRGLAARQALVRSLEIERATIYRRQQP